MKQIKGRGYIYVKQPKSFYDAEEHCKTEYGTHLATITRFIDIDNANSMLKDENVWIGQYSNNKYQIWLDGTEFVQDATNFELDIDLYSSNCRSLQIDGYIGNSNECDELLPFLCNREIKTREYIVVKQTMTYMESQEYCLENYATDLATVITAQELSDIIGLIGMESDGAWIGLKKMYDNHQNEWEWIDNTQCIEFNGDCTQFWDIIEPIHDCAYVSKVNGRIHSKLCMERMEYFVCNKPLKYYEVETNGNVIVTDKEIIVRDELDEIIENLERKNGVSIISDGDIWHGESIKYDESAKHPYNATYRMPTDWVPIFVYIVIGAFIFCGCMYCCAVIIFLFNPNSTKINQQRYSV